MRQGTRSSEMDSLFSTKEINDGSCSPTEDPSQYTYALHDKSVSNQRDSMKTNSTHDKSFYSSHLNRVPEASTKFDAMECDSIENGRNFLEIDQKSLTTSSIHLNEKPKCNDGNTRWNFSKLRSKVLNICQDLRKQSGVYSSMKMKAAGFLYTNEKDCAICHECQLKVSDWTTDMQPFEIHSKRSPNCPFVRSMQVSNPADKVASATTMALNVPNGNDQEQPCKRKKIEILKNQSHVEAFFEVDALMQVRQRTFSTWPHRNSPYPAEMVNAGFFHCNVSDRVLCIYCNLICQQWTPQTDDPWVVHKTLSPKCPYVKNALARSEKGSIFIVNGNSTRSNASLTETTESLRSHDIVPTVACHNAFVEIPKRYASFSSWPSEGLPSVDNLVRAGFFYTGVKTVVTCFYCNGSLQNWGSNDNPTIEHVRWFPLCAYAKQLCGHELYQKIQQSKRLAQEHIRNSDSTNRGSSNNNKLEIADESTLSRYIAARLDLPISQRLLNQGYKLSVIKRSWEDQLRLKKEDFATDSDLVIACIILQKQIDGINGKKENIVIPSIRMRQIFGQEQATTATQSSSSAPPAISDTEQNSITPEITVVEKAKETGSVSKVKSSEPTHVDAKTSDNSCVLCMTDDKQLACIPCGHFATCVPCGHSLRTCPICRRQIEAFVRIYT